MKLAFYKGTRKGLQGLYSRLTRVIDSGPYSHCEIIFNDGLSASASTRYVVYLTQVAEEIIK